MLFSNYEVFYDLLKETLNINIDIIDGIDLDIEESTSLKNIKMLINDINRDFGEDFIISMAPVQFTMENPNEPGMSGFRYISLYNSPEGKRINYFNVQSYSCYSLSALDTIIKNGYPVEKIVMGMLTGQDYQNIKNEVGKMVNKYKSNFGGVFIWEYYDAPPKGINDPCQWAIDMKTIINNGPSIRESLVNNIDYVKSNINTNFEKIKNNIVDIAYSIYYSNYFKLNKYKN